ncbi:MAG: phosphate ABC transporter substrate-binding protein PstS, partial [Terrabacter sp.]|nr:phosphate ABC transporter substrate-binding protein PstS [Terrabacter sp.]
ETGKKWTGKGEGKEKSAGVDTATKGQDGGITYVELSYAQQNQLPMAQIDTGAGPVELTAESAGKTIATAKQTGTGNDLALKIDYATKEAGAYPIVLVTYEIVCSKYADAETGKKVKAFLKSFASDETQKGLEAKGYAPLPAEVAAKVKTAVDAIS